MSQATIEASFSAQFERIKLVTGKQTQAKLAVFLGICAASVSDAKRRGKVPADWLVTLIRTKDVHPEWVLTGLGPCFIRTPVPGNYELGDGAQEGCNEREILQRLSSRALAEELIRRIALTQATGFSRKAVKSVF